MARGRGSASQRAASWVAAPLCGSIGLFVLGLCACDDSASGPVTPNALSSASGAGGAGGASSVGAGGAAGHVAGGGSPQFGGGGAAGAGGSDDQGGAGGAGGAGGQAPGPTVTLLDEPGVVFTPSPADSMRRFDFGDNGTVYTSVEVELDILAGAYQPEVPDEGSPDRTDHILFGLFRAHQAHSYQEYLMGAGAITWATTNPPALKMWGRLTIGQGSETYTGWKANYSWQDGASYHLDCRIDGLTHEQHCELWLDGDLKRALTGNVPYLDPATHLDTGFYVELGKEVPDEIETSPMGWVYSNLVVTATLAP